MSDIPSIKPALAVMRENLHRRRFGNVRKLADALQSQELSRAARVEIEHLVAQMPLGEQPAFMDTLSEPLRESVIYIQERFNVSVADLTMDQYLTFARAVISGKQQPIGQVTPQALIFRVAQCPPFSDLACYDLLLEAIWDCLELLGSDSDDPEVHLWITQSLELARQSIAMLAETNDPRLIGDIDRMLRFIVKRQLHRYDLQTEIFHSLSNMINRRTQGSVINQLSVTLAAEWGDLVNPGRGADWLPFHSQESQP